MKVAAMMPKTWFEMLVQGSLAPAVLIAAISFVLSISGLMALSFGFLLHGLMMLSDIWWCIKMTPEYIVMMFVASFVTRAVLGAFILYLAFNSGLSFGAIALGYLLSMAYYMYRKSILPHEQTSGAKLCPSH